MRPDYPTIVYSRILKQLFPDTPIIVGGIEASMRRLTHYDYWQDKLLPGILADCPADLLIYGMGERPIVEIARRLQQGENIKQLDDIPQTASMQPLSNMPYGRRREYRPRITRRMPTPQTEAIGKFQAHRGRIQ